MSTDISALPVILITGGNRGIGLELAAQLHARGDARVIVTCRAISSDLEALGVEVIEGVDVRDPSSLAAELEARGVPEGEVRLLLDARRGIGVESHTVSARRGTPAPPGPSGPQTGCRPGA